MIIKQALNTNILHTPMLDIGGFKNCKNTTKDPGPSPFNSFTNLKIWNVYLCMWMIYICISLVNNTFFFSGFFWFRIITWSHNFLAFAYLHWSVCNFFISSSDYSEGCIDWSQSMQRDPCNRKLACFDLDTDSQY